MLSHSRIKVKAYHLSVVENQSKISDSVEFKVGCQLLLKLQ